MKKGRPRTFATYFVQGFLSLLPLLVTVYIAMLFFGFIERMLDNVLVLLPPEYREMKSAVLAAEAAAIVVFIVAIATFGFMVRTLVGRSLVRLMDGVFDALPGLSVIYRTTKQVVELLQPRRESFFTRPVLVQYPSPGIWSLGFDTGQVGKAMQPPGSPQRHFTVFIPTTPNPTSGWLAVVPEQDLRPLQISVEEAVKMILTGGFVKTGGAAALTVPAAPSPGAAAPPPAPSQPAAPAAPSSPDPDPDPSAQPQP